MKNIVNISVIIPTYNNKKTIYTAINSIPIQNNIEIIIIDDGSIDNTKELIEKIKISRNVIYIKQKNKGVSVARNVGIKNAHGDYIMFLDSDDYYEKDIFNYIIDIIQTSHVNMIMFGYQLKEENSIKEKCTPTSSNNMQQLFFKNLNNGVLWMSVWNKVYNKKNLEGINFDSELKNGEDFDFNLQYLKKINFKKIKIINKVGYTYTVERKKYKYRKNSIESHMNITLKLLTLNNNIVSDEISNYFWNSIIYDLLALVIDKKHNSLKCKLKVIKDVKKDDLIYKMIISKELSIKKKIIIKIIRKFNALIIYLCFKLFSIFM